MLPIKRLVPVAAALSASVVLAGACGDTPRRAAPAVTPKALAASKPTLLIYGDSLTVSSESASRARSAAREALAFRAAPGTGICDWSAGAAGDREIYRPARVVVAFTGNVSNCSRSDFIHSGLTGLVDNYERSLRALAHAFAGLPITVVAPPAMTTENTVDRGWYPCNGNPALLAMYQRVSAELGLTYSTVADDSLTPRHTYTAYRPAYGTEDPLVRVRASDGIHLTPAGSVYYAVALVG